jgi:hypothetical protein
MGAVDFRVGGRIFATLAHAKDGYGNLMLSPEQQVEFCAEQPEIFLPIPGGWGQMGATHLRLAEAGEAQVQGALHTAWKRRVELNHRGPAQKSAKKTKPRKPVKKRAA